jgi:hypothetical protein
MTLTREDILNRKRGAATFPISDGTVTLRGLSRDEVLELQALKTLAEKQDYCVATAMINPKMTLEDVASWGKIPGEAGEITKISDEVQRLSGLGEGAGKSGVAGTRGKR